MNPGGLLPGFQSRGSVTVTHPAAAEQSLTWAMSGSTGATWSVTLSFYA